MRRPMPLNGASGGAFTSLLPAPLQAAFAAHLGSLRDVRALTGGSIAHTRRIDTDRGPYVVKYAAASAASAASDFAAEADGLAALAACPAIRVPAVVACDRADAYAFLVLEHLDLHPLASATETQAAAAGTALAELHRTVGTQYGWPRDNCLGHTPQRNTPTADWAVFFARHRLAPQLDLIAQKARVDDAFSPLLAGGQRLLERLPQWLAGHAPPPSLVHGDLWHGNAALDAKGRLVLLDPAVHHGDRESDLAMTRLFGGFPPAFYRGYAEAWPLLEGHARREALYRLYHVLNHCNLFGVSYRPEAERLIAALLVA